MSRLIVIQKPIKTIMYCDNCPETIETEIGSFQLQYGDVWESVGKKIECPTCGRMNVIEELTFD